jgi:hypothetical protein
MLARTQARILFTWVEEGLSFPLHHDWCQIPTPACHPSAQYSAWTEHTLMLALTFMGKGHCTIAGAHPSI